MNNYFSKTMTFEEIMANFKRLITISNNHDTNFSYEESLDQSIYIPQDQPEFSFSGFMSIMNSSRNRSVLSFSNIASIAGDTYKSTKGMLTGMSGGGDLLTKSKSTELDSIDTKKFQMTK